MAEATRLVVDGGVEGTNFFETVAWLSGISVQTIRNHFPTKNDLLWAAYDRLIQPILNPTIKKTDLGPLQLACLRLEHSNSSAPHVAPEVRRR